MKTWWKGSKLNFTFFFIPTFRLATIHIVKDMSIGIVSDVLTASSSVEQDKRGTQKSGQSAHDVCHSRIWKSSLQIHCSENSSSTKKGKILKVLINILILKLVASHIESNSQHNRPYILISIKIACFRRRHFCRAVHIEHVHLTPDPPKPENPNSSKEICFVILKWFSEYGLPLDIFADVCPDEAK